MEEKGGVLNSKNFNIPLETQMTQSKPWLKIVLFAGTGIILISSLVFVGYQLGIKQSTFTTNPFPTPLTTPTLFPTSMAVTTPTPDPTVDWKTYTNTELGFSVKYQKDWPKPQERLLATRTDVEFGSFATIMVGVFYSQEKQRELTYLEVARQYANGKKEPQLITVDNQPAAYVKISEEDLVAPKPNPYILVAIQKGRNVYVIYYSFINSLSNQKNEQIFNYMISTFKFLDQSSVSKNKYETEKNQIIELVNKFEKLQKQHGAIDVLILLPPLLI